MKKINFDFELYHENPKAFYDQCYALTKIFNGGDQGMYRGDVVHAFGTYYTITKRKVVKPH